MKRTLQYLGASRVVTLIPITNPHQPKLRCKTHNDQRCKIRARLDQRV